MALKSSMEPLSNEEIGDLLEQLGKLIDRTKIMYEQYFMGIQKMPPSQLHKDIERRIRDLSRDRIRNTSLRYRLTTLKQKYGSYNTYWRRILREIEQGRYIRDVARAGRRAARRGEDLPPEILANMPKRMRERIIRDRDLVRQKAERDASRRGDAPPSPEAAAARGTQRNNVHQIDEDAFMAAGDLDLDAMFDAITSTSPGTLDTPDEPAPAKSAPPATPAAAKRPAPPRRPAPSRPSAPRPPTAKPAAVKRAAPPPGMNEDSARRLYQQYVKAKKLVGERTDNLSYDRLMKSLNKQAPGIMTKHKAKGVDFGVVIKNDRVVLKAKPKK